MRLEHFRSDVNGIKSKRNHDIPTEQEVNRIWHNEKVVRNDGVKVFASDTMVEVRLRIGNGVGGNLYRDFYKIIN